MDDNPGTDYMCILYSMHELDINRIISSVRTGKGTFIDNILKSIESVTAPQNDITFNNNKMSFNAATNGTVLPVIVTINHK